MTKLPKILLFFQAGKENGWGHKYRSLEVINTAKKMGIETAGISNDKEATNWQFAINVHKSAMHLRPYVFKMLLNRTNPDWIIFDLRETPPSYMLELAKLKGLKIANLNGQNSAICNQSNLDQSWADLVWIQDSPERVILRSEMLNIPYTPLSNQWFVFGGSADPFCLIENFENAIQRDPAFLIGTKLRTKYTPKYKGHEYIECDGQDIYKYMANSSVACIHLGITAYELATFGVRQYIFSGSIEHLYYAKLIESYGLGLAYDEIGIPDGKNMREFFKRPINLNPKNKPDGLGAERFLKELIKIHNELE